MIKLRVQNYKNIDDIGWISCSDLTAFVGKNEAGKSAIFRGLSKLNPSDGEKYYGLKEFPRKRYTLEFKQWDWPVSSAEFQLSKDESEALKQICPSLDNSSGVICTRYYSWQLEVEFNPQPHLPDVSNKTYLQLVRKWHSIFEKTTSPEDKVQQLASLKAALLPFLDTKIQALTVQEPDDKVDVNLVTEVSNTIMSHFNEAWQTEQFKEIIEENEKFKKDMQVYVELNQAKEWVEKNLPKFIYFYEYDVIESAIHIPTFIQQLKQNPSASRLRTTRCLFQHVGLELETIQQLDPNKPDKTTEDLRKLADERAILMSSASHTMTQKFSEWWEQRKHKFRYQVDGAFFRIWVWDDLDPSEIELDQRSYGMQYFFSFYLVFLVEARGAHSNSILLLDEPGLHLHGTAQQKVVKFLEKLSEQNQVLYSTHSAFMVDGDHLDNVRVVYEDKENGTAKVSEDVWPNDKDSLFPLQAGLGYAIAQTLFYAKRQVVVEGLTDYLILKTVNEILSSKKMTSLRNDAIIVPSGGVNKLLPLASMLLGHEIKVAVLLDGDEPGIRKGKEVESKLLLNCLFMSTFANKKEAEIEDLFPEKLYLDAVKEAYPDAKTPIDFTEDEKKMQCIAKRVEAAFQRMGKYTFEKWRPAKIILDMAQKNPDLIPTETLASFESIFQETNRILR